MTRLGTKRFTVAVWLLAASMLLAARAGASTLPDTTGPADAYRKLLHTKISLTLTKSKDGGKPTVELAVAWMCKKAGVPYQVKRSRELGKDKVKTRIDPINAADFVAGKGIVAIAAKVDLVMKIDAEGVYLAPKPDEPTVERKLTPAERLQLGTTLIVELKPLHGKEVDKEYWGDKDIEQHVQLRIGLKSSRAFTSLKVVAYVFAQIQRDSLRWSDPEDDKRPRYGPKKEFVQIHKETFVVSGLPAMQDRELKTKVVKTSYELDDWYYSNDRRYGEKYYGCVVDIYFGDQLIKSVATTRKLHDLLGRDQRTGFPAE